MDNETKQSERAHAGCMCVPERKDSTNEQAFIILDIPVFFFAATQNFVSLDLNIFSTDCLFFMLLFPSLGTHDNGYENGD